MTTAEILRQLPEELVVMYLAMRQQVMLRRTYETHERAVDCGETRRRSEMNEYCAWHEDENGLWWTDCKEIHEFFDGIPTDNRYKFCPYCGKEIVEFKYKRDEAETGSEEGVMAMTELMKALEETSEALEFALSRLGCCGHGDGGDHKADVDDYGGMGLCARNKELLKKMRSNNIPDVTEAKAEAYDRLMSMNSVSKNDIEIVLDGDAWCAYRKPFRNLQEDDAGFGDTPQTALTALLESELPDGWEELCLNTH